MKNYFEALKEWEREYFTKALRENNNSVSKAARACGLNRTHFYRAMERSGVPKPQRKRGEYGNRGNKAWQELGRMNA